MSRGRKILLILTAILILLGLLGAAAYYLGYLDQFIKPKEGTPSETPEEAETTTETTEFSGAFVTAEVPEEWTIVEHKDGSGTSMLADGDYTGLTALEIKNPAGETVFALRGVSGIGGAGGCLEYFRFADDSTAHYNSAAAVNAEIGEPAPVIVDLTASSYSSINLFNTKVRRVGNRLYWDTDPATAEFESGCGIQENLFDFGAPQFTVVGQGTSGTYQWVVLSSASEEDLTSLDTILNSLTLTP